MFAEATTDNALVVLHEAIAKHGRPASILTDHGSQFYANQSEYKRRGASQFEQELVKLEIKHIMVRVNHPQTNGKLERFHGRFRESTNGLAPLMSWSTGTTTSNHTCHLTGIILRPL